MLITLESLEEALKLSRCKETCYEGVQDTWTEENSALGQCFVTSLLVQDLFGGDIVKAKLSNGIGHFWNIIDNQEIDMTRSQFITGEIIPEGIKVDRSGLDIPDRYKLLESKVFTILQI